MFNGIIYNTGKFKVLKNKKSLFIGIQSNLNLIIKN